MRSRLLVLLFLLGAAPALADAKPPKNKLRHVELVNLNILHGFACDPPTPADGDQCRVVDRIDLLTKEILAAGCPDLVTLQENVTAEFPQRDIGEFVGPLEDTTALIRERLPAVEEACGFAYEVVFPRAAERPPPFGRGTDEEMILSRYPVSERRSVQLYGPFRPFFTRHVQFARVEHPEGPIDVFTTHLASGADAATAPCGVAALPPPLESPPCPAECEAFVDTVRECEVRQLIDVVAELHTGDEPALVSGDFNAAPDSNEYALLTGEGWIDSHLAAGNAECEPTTGVNCTSGREDGNLSDLESPALNQTQRIDYVFVVPPGPGARCAGQVTTLSHPERAVSTTGLWAAEPNVPCGPAPLPTCFVSDHSGNQLNLACRAGR